MKITTGTPLLPVSKKAIYSFGECSLAKCACQEHVEAGVSAPVDEALLFKEKAPFGNLTLQHACCCLHLAQFQVIDQLWE